MNRAELRQWHGAAVTDWRARWGVPELHIFAAVGSTNDVARNLAHGGAPEGTTVLADAQTRGRGRRGRSWQAEPGQSLLLSMVVRPGSQGAESVLSLRLGLAAAQAIEAITPLAVGVKWPNDLMVGGRKLGGLLCEGVVEGSRFAFVVAGVGVNIHQQDDDWGATLAGQATSLAIRMDAAPEVPDVAGEIVARWLGALDVPGDRLRPDELVALAERDVLQGRAVEVDGRPCGVARGVDPEGGLRVERQGALERIAAGTVRLTETEEGEGS